ncbi:hypothetical protein J3E68DRAFT_406526 [Trichoderma sp. SZMC 28012]
MPAIHVLDDYYLAITVLNSPAVTRYPQHRFGTGRDIAGVVMYSIGLGIETVSDAQKYRFRSTHDGKAVCDGGFFGVSRHPNCFWEIFVHFAISMIAVSSAADGFVDGQAYKALMLPSWVQSSSHFSSYLYQGYRSRNVQRQRHDMKVTTIGKPISAG